jgi:hypothetical protein
MDHLIKGLYVFTKLKHYYHIWNTSIKFPKIVRKLAICNLWVHIIPGLLFQTIYYFIPFNYLIYVLLNIPLSVISGVFHTLYYHDIHGEITKLYEIKLNTVKKESPLMFITTAITLSIYITFIYLFISFISFIINTFLRDELKILDPIASTIILCIYHGFYGFNGYWSALQISSKSRIVIHEKYWLFFFGYTIVPSIVYYLSSYIMINNMFLVSGLLIAGYNMMMVQLIAIPYVEQQVINNVFRTVPGYRPLNLSIFTYLIKLLIRK